MTANESAQSLDERRLRIWTVVPDHLAYVLRGGMFKVASSIPTDAVLVGSGYDNRENIHFLIFSHISFSPLIPGNRIEIGDPVTVEGVH